MASASISGSVTSPEVEFITFDSGNAIAKFSVLDREYVYFSNEDKKVGQFFNVEVVGKPATWAVDRLKKGSVVKVDGQLVQEKYKEKVYYTVKNARVTFLDKRETEAAAF